MEKALERALDRAEHVIESVRQRPPKRTRSSSGEKSLHDKLYDLYVEECGKEPEVTEELISNVNLLEKLVQRESLSHLLVNLYPGEQGYSLMLKGPSEQYSETIRLPYEERNFLEYLDAEELPPALVDLLETSELNIFHSGCVIAEVREYRQCSNPEAPGYQSRHVLLRPTMQTLVRDVESIASNNQEWTQEDKLLLESQLILATADPLCLDPSVSVACIANRLLYNRQEMNTPAMRRNFKRYSTASLNWQQEPSCSLDPHKEGQAAQQDNLKISEAGKCEDIWIQSTCDLAVPSEVDVEQYAREVRSVKYHDSQLTEWPAYGEDDAISLFGCEAGDQSQTTQLTFMQSLGDPLISGQTSPKNARHERHMSPCHSIKDEHCYSLMPESNIDTGEEVQSLFAELEPLSAECAFEVSSDSSGSGSLSQLSLETEAAQPLDVSVQSSVLEKGVQYSPPPISPLSSSGKSPSGSDSLTPQQESSFHTSGSPAPASKPPSLPQKSSVEVNRVSTLPTATLCTISSSQTTPASQVKAKYVGNNFIKVAVPVPVAQTLVRVSNSTKGYTASVRTPVPIKPKIPSSADQQLPDIQPAVQQVPSQEPRPITVPQLPPGSLVLNTQQQSQQQPQQQPQDEPQQQQPCQQLQQPQQLPQQQPQHRPQQPQQQPQQQPWQPQWQPLQQPGQLPQKQPCQLPLQSWQQPQRPQQVPWQQPQQPQQQLWHQLQQPHQLQQQPWQQPWQQPQQVPQPQQQLWHQPQQPHQLQQQPQQQPWQQPQQPQQFQQQPWQQPQQPQQEPWQQPQQPQQQPWKQPQQFCQLIPQLQQPIYCIQQSLSQHSTVHHSTHRRKILPARKTPVPNPERLGSNLQPQRVLGSQPSSTQTRPEQSHPQQSVQLSYAFQQQPQSQQVQLRILPLPVPVSTVATQGAQPHHGQKAASQSKGEMNRGLPDTPKS